MTKDDILRYFSNSHVLAWLVGVNAAVFVLLWIVEIIFSLSGISGLTPAVLMEMPSNLHLLLRRPWTVLTYMVTQSDPIHLLVNMIWLMWFGRIFLFCSNGRSLLTAYVGGGIAGALAYIICGLATGSSSGMLVGASASVIAVMAAPIILAPNMRLNMMLFGQVRLKWLAIVCILLTFVGVGGNSPGGQAAHLGGLLFGLLFALYLRRRQLPENDIFADFYKKASERLRANRKKTPINREAASKAMTGRLCDEDRLDQLLDKVRISGYDSLNEAEKRELNAISSRL